MSLNEVYEGFGEEGFENERVRMIEKQKETEEIALSQVSVD